jgi:hypothetical protein
MTTRKDDGRRLIQITMLPDLYLELREHCRKLDIPVSVWARELIKRELSVSTTQSNP